MKSDPTWLIPQKVTANLGLLLVQYRSDQICKIWRAYKVYWIKHRACEICIMCKVLSICIL